MGLAEGWLVGDCGIAVGLNDGSVEIDGVVVGSSVGAIDGMCEGAWVHV